MLCELCAHYGHFTELGVKHSHIIVTGCEIFPSFLCKGYPYGSNGKPKTDLVPCTEFVPDLRRVTDRLLALGNEQKHILKMLNAAVGAITVKEETNDAGDS